MSEREGLYCQKHGVWCADGLCADCDGMKKDRLVAGFAALAERLARLDTEWPKSRLPEVERPCDHAAGYCKDTAHKYELPVADPEE